MSVKKKALAIDGVVLVHKEQGASSQQVVTQLKRLLNAAKAGHTGTLDPLATGLLPICLGEATKFSQQLLDADKAYRAHIVLGQQTDTADAAGVTLKELSAFTPPTREAILTALAAQLGVREQVPPMHSALKVNGKALYQYAREGQSLPRAPRTINIYRIELNAYDSQVMHDGKPRPSIDCTVWCSKGTYIRTLAEEIGAALNLPAYLAALERTEVGTLRLQDALALSTIATDVAKKNQPLSPQSTPIKADDSAHIAFDWLHPVDYLITHWPRLELNPAETKQIRHGHSLAHKLVQGYYRLYGASDSTITNRQFIGVGQSDGIALQPYRLCDTAQALPSAAGTTNAIGTVIAA